MTIEQYKARNVQILEEIQSHETNIIALENRAGQYRIQAQEWLNARGNDGKGGCTGNKKTKAACEEDKTWKEAQADAKIKNAQADEARAKQTREVTIPDLRTEFANNEALMQAQQISDAEVSRILAGKGQTVNSVKVFAEKQGEAEIQRQTLVGQAEAQKVNEQSKTNKTIGYVVLGLVGIGALVGLAFLVKKLRK